MNNARSFAASAHQGQLHGQREYADGHLHDVYRVLLRFGWHDEPELLDASWLHDVVEDTSTTADDVALYFGQRVADLVDAVTDVTEGVNRAARKQATYLKTMAVPLGPTLKLADRIANVEFSWADGGDKFLRMYGKEHEAFVNALYGRDRDERTARMETYLDHILDGVV